jgi:hypothetical protein
VSWRARVTHGRTRDDAGAALVLALVFITVVAIGVATLLSFADTSLRSTVALRGQATQSAGAAGAADIAIDTLRHGTYTGTGNCFGTSSSLLLSNFYKPPTGSADSELVTCAQDPNTSQIPSAYALLTLGNQKDSHGQYIEDGIDVQADGDTHHHDYDGDDHDHRDDHNHNSDAVVNFKGSIGSKSDIQIDDHATVTVTGNVKASQCDPGIDQTGSEICNSSTGSSLTDPNYAAPAPPASGTTPTMPSCGSYMKFLPGLYSSSSTLTTLNNLMSCSSAKTFDFRPGYYYFNFSGTWTISKGTLVAGSLNQLTSSPPTIPGACASPVPPATPDPSTNGVVFVFGNSAQMSVTNDANVEICGKYSTTGPAFAIYGLKSTIGSGSTQVLSQRGCVTDNDYSGSDPCAFIRTDSNHSDDVDFLVHGLVYAPTAWVDLDLTDSQDQHFDDGMVVRAFSIKAQQDSHPPTVISIPSSMSSTRTVVYLTVYVCPGVSTCTTSTGKVRLRAKVGISDPTGSAVAGKREITVYSWSNQR